MALDEEILWSREQLELILQGVDDGITVQDRFGRLVYANAAAAYLSGYPSAEALLAASPEEVMEKHEVVDEERRPFPFDELPGRKVLAGEEAPERVLGFRDMNTGEERWSVVKASPVFGADGAVHYAINVFVDVTDRKRAEEERALLLAQEREAREQAEAARLEAEAAQRRFQFLAEASKVLASSLDYRATLASVAHLAVPQIADWCVVDTFSESGSIVRLAAAHTDPSKERWAREMERHYPPDERSGATMVTRTGQPILVAEITDDLLVANARDERHLTVLRELGMQSAMTVPLSARGRILGSISFIAAESGRRYGPADLQLAEELAARAALAVDNARLYGESVRVAAQQAAILAHMADGVLVVDATGTLAYVNPAARRLLGLDTCMDGREVTVERINAILQTRTSDGRSLSTEETALGRALHGETLTNVERRLRRPDGSDIIAQVSTAPIVADDGTELGAVSVFRDVTAQYELEQLKQDFLSAAAHDLKTPLTSIRLLAQTLERRLRRASSIDPAKLAENLKQISDTTVRMDGLVSQLLDVSRTEMGQPIELRQQPGDLVELVRRVVAEAQRSAGSHRITLETDVPAAPSAFDHQLLERLLTNLLSNAVKYSPRGTGVTVRMAREDGADGSCWAVVAVCDQGIGIPADDLPHIFERFYRARNVGTEIPGTGIGLVAARQIVEQHGGQIELESEEGRGTTVTVRLPLVLAET